MESIELTRLGSIGVRESKIWSFILNNPLSLITITVAVIVIVLEQAGLLPDKLIPTTILAVVTLLATTEIVENRRKVSKIEEELKSISNQITSVTQGVRVRTFSTADEAYNYFRKKTQEATDSIDQASLDNLRSLKIPSRTAYEKARKEVIVSDHLKVRYRYVGFLNTPRRLQMSLDFISTRKLYRYYAGFYLPPVPKITLISFIIFDEREVFTRIPYELGGNPGYIAISSPDVAKLFLGYFEKLWADSIKVQTKEEHADLLEQLVAQNDN